MSCKANRFKVMGGLLIVVMALFAVLASTASAVTWTTESLMTSGQEMEIGAEASGNSVLSATVSGVGFELIASKVEAVTGTKIIQTGTVAKATGSLKYSGLTLRPIPCSPPASVTTKPLKGEVIAASGLATGRGFKLQPSSTTEPLLFAVITFTGSCALAGTPFKVTMPSGSYFCGEVEPLTTMLREEPIRSSATISEKCGSTLEAGGNTAFLTGTALGLSKPGGVLSAEKWGAQ